MPSALFLPDLYYDRRIWDDILSGLYDACDVVCFDAHEPMRLAGQAFLDAVRRLEPDPRGTVVVAAGLAAGFAVRAALSGLAGGLLLFQPAPDRIPPEAMTEVLKASRETDVT